MMVNPDGKTLILMGGWTAEAEVSRSSAAACVKAATSAGWNATCLEVDRNIAQNLMSEAPDQVFNALHGQMGEDGNIQGLLNIMNIPYTHSGVRASAIAMDKITTKQILRQYGIRFPKDLPITNENGKLVIDHQGPVAIKPRNDGSSIGVLIGENTNLPHYSHWITANSPEPSLMAEVMIPGRELTVAVLNGHALAVTEIFQDNAFYDYHAKYAKGGSRHKLPADIPCDIADTAMNWAKIAHQQIGCRGISRTDFRWDDQSDELFMLEINTQPGMTDVSLVPEQAEHVGLRMEDLVNQLLEAAQCD